MQRSQEQSPLSRSHVAYNVNMKPDHTVTFISASMLQNPYNTHIIYDTMTRMKRITLLLWIKITNRSNVFARPRSVPRPPVARKQCHGNVLLARCLYSSGVN